MLFIGDDWAEGQRDIEVKDDTGHRLARMRLPEGVDGLARLHEVIAEHLDTGTDSTGIDDPTDGAVVIGIETDRGVWVSALLACGYRVYAINPMSAARYRERHCTSGAKSDAGDAHVLAEIVRVDRDHHRQIAGDSTQVEALKLLARAHQGLISGSDPAPAADAVGVARVLSGSVDCVRRTHRPGHLGVVAQGSRSAAGSAFDYGADHRGTGASAPARGPHGQGHPHPGCAAGAVAAATRCDRRRVRDRRRRTSPHV